MKNGILLFKAFTKKKKDNKIPQSVGPVSQLLLPPNQVERTELATWDVFHLTLA